MYRYYKGVMFGVRCNVVVGCIVGGFMDYIG